MENIRARSISTILTIILIVIMTIYAELSKAFKEFLVSLTGHHWISKGVISLIFFMVAYFILAKYLKEKDIKKDAILVAIFTILGSLTIFIFYIYEFFA